MLTSYMELEMSISLDILSQTPCRFNVSRTVLAVEGQPFDRHLRPYSSCRCRCHFNHHPLCSDSTGCRITQDLSPNGPCLVFAERNAYCGSISSISMALRCSSVRFPVPYNLTAWFMMTFSKKFRTSLMLQTLFQFDTLFPCLFGCSRRITSDVISCDFFFFIPEAER